MIETFDYQEAHEEVLQTLLAMKKGLDKYRSKENYNEKWAKEMETRIIKVGKYLKATQRALSYLNEEVSESYRLGLQRGKELSNQGNQDWRYTPNVYNGLIQHFLNKDILVRLRSKEALRKILIEKSKNKWHELY